MVVKQKPKIVVVVVVAAAAAAVPVGMVVTVTMVVRCFWRRKFYLHDNGCTAADNGVFSGGDDVSENSASTSVTSNLQELDNCVHSQPPAVNLVQSNCNTRTMLRTEPEEFLGSTDVLSTPNDEQSTSSLETTSMRSGTTVSGVFKEQNSEIDRNKVQIQNESLLERRTNQTADDFLMDEKLLLRGKHVVKLKRFEGIGPTDEDTGIPIASKAVSMIRITCFKIRCT